MYVIGRIRCACGVVGHIFTPIRRGGEVTKLHVSRTPFERGAIEGDSPVGESVVDFLDMFPSNAGHVEPRVNLGGPSPKAKYYSVTDSEPVP